MSKVMVQERERVQWLNKPEPYHLCQRFFSSSTYNGTSRYPFANKYYERCQKLWNRSENEFNEWIIMDLIICDKCVLVPSLLTVLRGTRFPTSAMRCVKSFGTGARMSHNVNISKELFIFDKFVSVSSLLTVLRGTWFPTGAMRGVKSYGTRARTSTMNK
jgi:hypothetical protein